MEKLLLFQITPEESIRKIAQRLHLRTVSVPICDYSKSIGQLAGFPDDTADKIYTGAPLESSLLVLCNVKERHIDQLLEKLRIANLSISYKAVLTATNRHWNVLQLYEELHREHLAITKNNKFDSVFFKYIIFFAVLLSNGATKLNDFI